MEWNDWLSVVAIVIAILALIIRWKMFFNTISKIQEKLKGFPDKKDLAYWILILIIIISFVATWRTDDPGKLADQLSLGGTLISILLAVVAIIFSFIQSSDSSRSTLEVLDRINAATNSLDTLERLNKEMSTSFEKMYFVTSEMAHGMQKMKESTSDVETINKVESGLIIWEKVQEKVHEATESHDLPVTLFIRNKRHEEIVLLRLVGGAIIKFNKLLDYLVKETGANYNQNNFREMLYDMEARGMLVLEHKDDGNIYIKRAP